MHRSSRLRTNLLRGASVAALAACATVLAEHEARACGGCFTPPAPPSQTASDITDERMLLATSPTQSTLYDQIAYSGSPSSFAWVLPIHGTVTVGLSADVLFDSFDALTVTTIYQPPSSCPPPPSCGYGGGATLADGPGAAAEDAGAVEDAAAPGPPPVTVTKEQNVGPYETVQLHSTSPSALENWLSQNSFEIPAAVKPVIAEYVNEGFDFLAMKLLPGQGIQSMRPVRVTTPGSSLTLPLRMAAIGTGATVGITIWVVADGRYEPQNFPFFRIQDSQIVWDWSTQSSNYTTLRQQEEASYDGKGWEIESSLSLAQLAITNTILSGGVLGPVFQQTPVSDASADYLPVTDANGNITETADQVRDDDIQALFVGVSAPNVRVTRIRSDISHAAMANDFVLQASSDQSELANVRNVTKSINETCPIYSNSCAVVGYGTVAQAEAAAAAEAPAAHGGGFSCNAARRSPMQRPVTVGAMGAIAAIALVRLRRRRPKA